MVLHLRGVFNTNRVRDRRVTTGSSPVLAPESPYRRIPRMPMATNNSHGCRRQARTPRPAGYFLDTTLQSMPSHHSLSAQRNQPLPLADALEHFWTATAMPLQIPRQPTLSSIFPRWIGSKDRRSIANRFPRKLRVVKNIHVSNNRRGREAVRSSTTSQPPCRQFITYSINAKQGIPGYRPSPAMQVSWIHSDW